MPTSGVHKPLQQTAAVGRRLRRLPLASAAERRDVSPRQIRRLTLDTARLKEHLARQLQFLDRSVAAFDAGHRDEAIRIATTVRHDARDTGKHLAPDPPRRQKYR
jgi:hypothetical protein